MKESLQAIIQRYISEFGEHDLAEYLSTKIDENSEHVLTVICNKDVHAIPDSVIRGEEFVFSRGHIDLSNEATIVEEMTNLLSALAAKLKTKAWKKIFIVPSGHPLFYGHVKFMIYRVTRIEATDVVYVGDGKYIDLRIPHRPIIAKS